MISYEINPSSGPVAAQKVLGIRHAAFDEKGSYALPDRLKRHPLAEYDPVAYDENGNYILEKGDPRVKEHPDVRLAPHDKINPKLRKKLARHYTVRQFGVIPKDGKAYVCIQPPAGIYIPGFGYGTIIGRAIDMQIFDLLNSYVVRRGPLEEKDMDELMRDPAFSETIKTLFKEAGFLTEFDREQEAKQVQEACTTVAGVKLQRDYSRPQNGYHSPKRALSDA